jgi:hypothetical protein
MAGVGKYIRAKTLDISISLNQDTGGRSHAQCTFVKKFLASATFKPAIRPCFLPGFRLPFSSGGQCALPR